MKKAALTSLATTKPRWKKWEALLANQPAIYICVLLTAIVVSYGYEVRTRTIFSCQAGGYSPDRYLAYCHGANYGDYDHGAFLFDLEPSVLDSARNADVLFLGNSRLQIGLSTAATASWFTAASASYYLMGFGYFENELYERELLRKIGPRARVYVINVDNFFDLTETPPVKTLFHEPGARDRYKWKQFWQRIHASICKRLADLCGGKYAIFRSRQTGAYYTEAIASVERVTPVSYDESVDQEVVERNAALATDFLLHFAQGKCVILTAVPYVGTKVGNAQAIAAHLGKRLVTPGNLEGLRTFDGLHLNPASAARWSEAFLQAAGPEIQSCLKQQGAAQP